MAEYIEREAAIKAIYDSDPNGIRRTLGFNVGQIEEALRAVPAVSVPQWISVKDRLPEDGEDVLIWYEYFRYGPYNRMYTTYDIAYQYNGYWEDAGGSLGKKARVFAWMPLPEPPKGENDG